MSSFTRVLIRILFALSFLISSRADPIQYQAGTAKIDITPSYPIRLSGYAVRKGPSIGIQQHIWARALAIKPASGPLAIIVAVDNCALPATVIDAAAALLRDQIGLPREQFTVCSSHTHSAPCVTGALPNLFVADLPPSEKEAIDRYTRELIAHIAEAAAAAAAHLRPAQLAFGWTKAFFAQNRRTRGGPVDWDVPVFRVAAPDGQILAVLATYACHCTTLGGDFNKISGDWIGYGSEQLEQMFPGAVALLTAGCGADSNPQPRNTLELAQQHGREIADSVQRAVLGGVTPLHSNLKCSLQQIELPFETVPSRDLLDRRAQQPGIVGYHARVNLAKLDRGETLPDRLQYPVQSWQFGGQLAIVFLGGEVVVDYALRLKHEFDPARLWISAYANDVPCYIPSKRILAEGGYEAEESLWYYDRPARLKPEIEDRIVRAVHQSVSSDFILNPKKAEFPPPKSPEDALASLRTDPNLDIQLAAAEPLVVDPVAIDFGPDGKLWVVEMRDYPAGLDGQYKPGGRIKFLEDLDGDGKYDRATVFLDGLPFPTGIFAWKKGVFICAAPDILYAEDTNGDGKADKIEKRFSGFATHNYQARVNGLSFGLDNWIYGASGLFGATIQSSITGKTTSLSGRDFRLQPDTGEFEPASGLSQQGRVRDDWDNWFGCDNSNLIWHFPFPERYVRRNPSVTPSVSRISLPAGKDPDQLFPISRTLRRFNDPASANRTTSACGLGIYRDDLLGPEYYNNAFVCEPVHNMVRRLSLAQSGISFQAQSATQNQTEFLASTDNWFRPVQALTGPDGALWIVDMYRFVIEHPRWITPDRLAELNVRAGDDKGRIYRIIPRQRPARKIPVTASASPPALISLMSSPNGVVRDRAEQELIWRGESGRDTIASLEQLLRSHSNPAVRIQALSTLAAVGALSTPSIEQALRDSHPALRRLAIRLSENASTGNSHLKSALLQLRNDPDPAVQLQLAFTLGAFSDPDSALALAQIAARHLDDESFKTAVLSSAKPFATTLLKALLREPDSKPRMQLIDGLIRTAVGQSNPQQLEQSILILLPPAGAGVEIWRWQALGALLGSLRQDPSAWRTWQSAHPADTDRLSVLPQEATSLALNPTATESTRLAALEFLGRSAITEIQAQRLQPLLQPSTPLPLQLATAAALARAPFPQIAFLLLQPWSQYSPSVRLRVLEALLSRKEWTATLIGALKNGQIAIADLPAAIRARLQQHSLESVRQAASSLFAAKSASRAAIVHSYQPAVALKGDPAKGALLFANNCVPCHRFRGQGHEVGPNLAALTDKSASALLIAILDPNAAIDERYKAYQIETQDQRSLAGIIIEEAATGFTLLQANGDRETLLRSEVAAIRASNLSLMPEGFEQLLQPQDLADLISYLQSGPAQFGSGTPGQLAAAQHQYLSQKPAGFARLINSPEQLPYPSWIGSFPLAVCRQSDGLSKITWTSAPAPAKIISDQFYPFQCAGAMGFASQPAGKFKLRINDTDILDFDVTLDDKTWQAADGAVRVSYLVMQNNDEDSNGPLLIEIKGSRLSPNQSVQFEVAGSASHTQRWFGIYLTSPPHSP